MGDGLGMLGMRGPAGISSPVLEPLVRCRVASVPGCVTTVRSHDVGNPCCRQGVVAGGPCMPSWDGRPVEQMPQMPQTRGASLMSRDPSPPAHRSLTDEMGRQGPRPAEARPGPSSIADPG